MRSYNLKDKRALMAVQTFMAEVPKLLNDPEGIILTVVDHFDKQGQKNSKGAQECRDWINRSHALRDLMQKLGERVEGTDNPKGSWYETGDDSR